MPFDRCNAARDSPIALTSRDSNELYDFVDHLVCRHTFGVRLIGEDETVPQYVVHNRLHVLRRDIIAPRDPSVRPCHPINANGTSRTRAEEDPFSEILVE